MSAHAAPVQASSAAVEITLERTRCFGACPSYKVTIDGAGDVTYVGQDFVRVKGEQHARIDPASVAALIGQFEKIDFFNLQDNYTASITDLPTTFVTLTLDGRTKRIRDYASAPASLRDLERTIERISGARRWIAVDAATVRELQASDHPLAGADLLRYLARAIWQDDVETATALIEAGANPLETIYRERVLAAATSPEMLRALIRAGVSPNQRGPDGSPRTLYAAAQTTAAVVEALIDSGADARATDARGVTMLMAAADAGRFDVVEMLLGRGADVRARTERGQTALDMATTGCPSNSIRPPGDSRDLPVPDCAKVRALLLAALAKH